MFFGDGYFDFRKQSRRLDYENRLIVVEPRYDHFELDSSQYERYESKATEAKRR